MMINKLSADIFQMIQQYFRDMIRCFENTTSSQKHYLFNDGSELNKKVEAEKQWRAFINTSNIFREIKRSTMYLTLVGRHAIRYLEDQAFRDRVDSLVRDRQKQIRIMGWYDDLSSYEYHHWNGIHALFLFSIKVPLDLSPFVQLTVLSFQFCPALRFVTRLPQVQTITVHDCDNLHFISHLPTLKTLGVSELSALKEISSLPSLKALEVVDCPLLVLSQSVLQSIQSSIYLYESEASSLTPSSAKISEFFSWFSHLEVIKITGFMKVIDTTLFRNVFNLGLYSCPKVHSVQNLSHLQILSLEDCEAFHCLDFQTLPALHTIQLEDCPALTDMQVIPPRIVNTSPGSIPVIKSLAILNCVNLKTMNIWRHVRIIHTDEFEERWTDWKRRTLKLNINYKDEEGGGDD